MSCAARRGAEKKVFYCHAAEDEDEEKLGDVYCLFVGHHESAWQIRGISRDFARFCGVVLMRNGAFGDTMISQLGQSAMDRYGGPCVDDSASGCT